jgi:GxxExxY protein
MSWQFFIHAEIQRFGMIEHKAPLTIEYKSHTLKKEYNADFICYNKIIVKTKALDSLVPKHESQVLNYLKATHF